MTDTTLTPKFVAPRTEPATFKRVLVCKQELFNGGIIHRHTTISLHPQEYADLLKYAYGSVKLLHAELRKTAIALPPRQPEPVQVLGRPKAKPQDFSDTVRTKVMRSLRSAYRPEKTGGPS